MKGRVKFYNRKKGFGFVTGEDGKDYFIHITSLTPGTRLFENTAVEFEPAEGEKGLKADNVKIDTSAEEISDPTAVPVSSESAQEEPQEISEEKQGDSDKPEEESH